MWSSIVARLRRRIPGRGVRFGAEDFASLSASSPTLVGVSVDGVLVFANTAAERSLGSGRPGELRGRPIFELVHAEDRAEARALIDRVLETGGAMPWTEVRMLDGAGEPVAHEVSAAPVEFEGTAALMLLARDLSEKRRAEEALRESEGRYQALAARAPVAIYRLDAEGHCIYLNQRWSELVGIPVDEALGRSWIELASDDGKALAAEVWRRIVAGPGEYRAEHQLRRRDDDILHVLSQVAPERDARGAVVGWVGTLTDLTDLKHAEFALADSEERLRVALEAAGMASWEADLESARVQWSPNAASVLGLPENELPKSAQEAWLLIEPAEVIHRTGNARDSLDRGEPFEIELRIARLGEEPRWILVRGQARAADSSRGRRVVGVVVDITARHRLAEERKQLEQKLHESQRLESLGLLAGGVAHDFNNLLVGILGNAELALARLSEDAPVRALVEELRAAAARAGDLAHQILAYSGRGTLQTGPVDVAEIARDTITLLRPSLPPGARLDVEAPADPPFVAGDLTQLRQVLMNLVTNACESLSSDGGDVRIRIARRSVSPPAEGPDTAWVALEVADTGAGMDPQTRERIFDPFFTTRSTGRGLGLAVVHGIVRAHGGTIDVDSAPGHGTTMRLLLPATHAPRAEREPPSAARAEPDIASALILVVDDERAVRGVARLALEAAGHRVLLAANGEEASARLKEHAHELGAIVLDLTLGRESSESVLTEIRARAREVPVLVMSGYPEEDAIARLAALGVSAFVQKPFTPAQLAERVARVIAGAKAPS